MSTFAADLVHAFRMFAKKPAFALTAILTVFATAMASWSAGQ